MPHAASVCGGGAPAAPARGVSSFAPFALVALFTATAWEQLPVLFQHPGLRTGLKGVGGGPAYYTHIHTYTTAAREQLPGPHHTGAAVQMQPAARQGSNSVLRQLGSNVPGESMPQTRGVRPCGHSRARERRGSVNFCSQPAGLAAAADRGLQGLVGPRHTLAPAAPARGPGKVLFRALPGPTPQPTSKQILRGRPFY